MPAALNDLYHLLPTRFEGSLEDQARAALRLLITASLNPRAPEPPSLDPSHCPNCLDPAPSLTSPYCTPFCKEESAFVRQLRRGIDDGTILNEERQVFLAHSFWHVIGAGYPHRLPIIPESAKKQALKRTENQCEICGNPAATFDHKGSG